ncbi:von willebrand factor [Sporothrix schenckii 1099-18]|uniref:VWFA domain-containing protein n=2 Tax=Sporothrix schenckii TaxID=29908 RepID=U7PZ96_SPOS1|nr:von willebrand factor [Sporothrix schenckii 1099-18]ERT00282.1 hypothetical protein HMPREF1624_03653 [Sporothrix schenckii ATCC 58251]KJR85253.1 von willebrand factor [Sporothrix schenckii 1099-18]
MSNNNGRDGVRKSFFGSLKNSLRKGTSSNGDGSVSPVSPGGASASSPIPPANRGLSASQTPSSRSRPGFPEPTRRPSNEPPPPYSAISELPGSTPAAAPAASAPATAPTAAPAPPAIGFSIRPASPTPSQRSSASARPTIDNVRSAEDPYAFLSMFDTIFVIDDSGSMAGRPWREVQAVLANITPICTQHDADGIDIYFLNHKNTPAAQGGGGQQARVPPGKAVGGYHNVTDAAAVSRIFQTVKPGGATPTGTRLHNIFQPYLRYYEAKRNEMEQRGEYGDPDPDDIKPVNMIVITDGVPTDDLDTVLVRAAKKLDSFDAPPFQVGVQFFQVGTEAEAAAYLRHLDDNLGNDVAGGIRDMVDTVTWDAFVSMNHGSTTGGSGPSTALGLTADGILKAVLGAVVKRLDRRPTGPSAPPANDPSTHRYLTPQR